MPPPGGTTIVTIVGGSAGGSTSSLLIDPTAGTFQYAPAAGVNSTFTGIDCLGNTHQVPVDWPIGPFPTWPLTFTLPNSVQALSQSNFSFQDGNELTNGALITPPWIIGFQLKPVYNDDVDHPCPPPKDVSSSIGCHNQSLKEDVPIVGTPFFLHYESSRSPGRSGAFGPAVKDTLGGVRLDGLSVAMVGNLVDANTDRLFATLYLDGKATEQQSDALTQIVEYMNGAYVALADQPPVPFNRVKRVSIRFDESRDRTRYSLEIPSILQEQAVLKRDKSGEPMFTMTAMDLWSNIVHNADNLKFEYHDRELGKSWDHSGNYANLKYFTVTKQMYRDQKMLGQHGDMSGSWTPEQLEIIRETGLKEKQ